MSEWVARSRSADGSSFEPSEEVREALVVIGTNNLRLLVRFISYDPGKSPFIPLFRVLPRRVNLMSIFDFVTEDEERRNKLNDGT